MNSETTGFGRRFFGIWLNRTMGNNIILKIRIFRKKIRDMKLKTKIRIFLFLITIATVIGIGNYSYHTAEKELIKNSKDAVLSLEMQGSRSLDDRINSFQDVSYRIIQTANIEKLLNYSIEEALSKKTANEGLPAVISQQTSLTEYIKYALLRPNSGVIYDYYRNDQKKIKSSMEQELLNKLDETVDLHHPISWTVYNNQVFFTRQVISLDFEEKGIMCFAIDDIFFEFLGNELNYLSDDNVMILNKYGEILKCDFPGLAEELIKDLEKYHIENYYAYLYQREWKKSEISVTVINAPSSGWTLISYFSHDKLLKGIQKIKRGMLEVIIGVFVLSLLITTVISRTITKNVNIIECGMKHYEEGDFGYRISPASYDEVGLLGLQLNYMAVRLHEMIEMLQIREEEKKKLEIETLQAQINPHFLYNTLGSLKWAAFRNGQKELAGSLDALIQLLRFTIKKANGMVTVAEETEYIHNYVLVEQMRYGNQIQVFYDIEESVKEVKIPGFILQPLVENCFIHGLDQTKSNGQIEIRAYKEKDFLYLEVEDNGMGIPKEKLAHLLTPSENHKTKGLNSIGMKIVDRRLKEIYGEKYKTDIYSIVDQGTRIRLVIPWDDINNDNIVEE